MSTRDQFTPYADPPMSTESSRFLTVRPPPHVAADPSSATINLGPGESSPADPLRTIAAIRAGRRHALRRLGERLWLLLYALSLLDGPASTARAIAQPEDDYRRLAARQQETRARCVQGTGPPGAMTVHPIHKQRQRHLSHE